MEGTDGEQFGTGGASVIRVANGTFSSIGSLATTAEITAALTAAEETAVVQYCEEGGANITGTLFKDLGRTLTVYDATTALHVATYRECQLVAGGPEGVPEDTPTYGADYYVRVWAADGDGVAVARLG
ncbi:MAG: hypothetical protein EBX37_10530 [Alphaproteobacteria bacterium]|nr:hypothetical protein [Alphaproteobacteria bacterium]